MVFAMVPMKPHAIYAVSVHIMPDFVGILSMNGGPKIRMENLTQKEKDLIATSNVPIVNPYCITGNVILAEIQNKVLEIRPMGSMIVKPFVMAAIKPRVPKDGIPMTRTLFVPKIVPLQNL